MTRAKLGWSAGLGAAVLVTLLVTLFASYKGERPVGEEETPAKRDPSGVPEVELEIILNKIREGDLHHRKGDLKEARHAWEEARRLGRGLWPIHEGLGDSFAGAQLLPEAIREYGIAASFVSEHHPDVRLGILFKKAQALAASGQSLEALGTYLELGVPRHSENILELALKVPDRAQAEKMLSERARIFDPHIFSVLSAFYSRTGRPADAAEALAHFAMAVAPWDEQVNRPAIEGLRTARRFDLALELCRAWVRSTPQAPGVYRLMGDLLREAGREKEAIVAYTSIVDVRPGDAEAHRELGQIFRGLDREDEAIAQYEDAKQARPEDPISYTTLVSLYETKGDAKRAEETLLEGVKRHGLGGELRSRLVAVYEDRISKQKQAGRMGVVRALRRKLGELNVAEGGLFDLKIIMTWDAPSDVDLDVFEPGGEHIDHTHAHSKAGGHYYVDNTRGYGPETYTLPIAIPGTYRIGAHLHGNLRSTIKFVVILDEDSPREKRREETLVLESSAQGTRFIQDLVIEK